MDMEKVTALSRTLGLPRIYQLGIVVRDLQPALRFYSRFFGISSWYRGEVGEQETIFRGEQIALNADMVFAYSRKLMIELIEVRDNTPNIYTEHLERFGEGLHHLGFETAHYDVKLQQARDMGIEVIQSGFIRSKGGALSRMAYLDTGPFCGYPIELMETRLFGFALGKGRFMMNVGCLLGDAARVPVP